MGIENKVKKPGIASFLVLLIVGFLGQFGIEISAEVATAATGLLAFVVGYFVEK